MPSHIVPDQLATAYEFLRTLEPFSRWAKQEGTKALPHADNIEFRVIGDRRLCAYKKRRPDGGYIIAYSDKAPRHVANLMMYMAHEMIHVYQDLNKLEGRSLHNRDFVARAEEVCIIQGYDPRLFV